MAVAWNRRGVVLLAQCLETKPADLESRFVPVGYCKCSGKLPLSNGVRQLLHLAKSLVEKPPSSNHPGLIGLPHLVCALACSLSAKDVPHIAVPSEARALELLAEWLEAERRPPSLGELTERLRALRRALLDRIYGQDHAIHQFVDGLFNVEVVREVDTTRRAPAGLFVFAGPPGVGKTYLAELGASHLDRPFKRFDMSTYAREHEAATLIGTPPMLCTRARNPAR